MFYLRVNAASSTVPLVLAMDAAISETTSLACLSLSYVVSFMFCVICMYITTMFFQ